MKKKELLIVGGTSIWAIETYFAKYLNEFGWKTFIFDCSRYFQYNSILFKIRNRARDLSIYNLANKELINYCEKHKPGIVWVFKGVEIFPSTLQQLTKMGVFLANYNPDHPFIRTSIVHGGKNIPLSIPLYDLHFSYNSALCAQIQNEYNKPCIYLPFGFELENKNYNQLKNVSEINKLCFVGTPDAERVKLLAKIGQTGLPIDIYSLNYQKRHVLDKFSNIRTLPVVLGMEFWETIRKYRVQLNFLRKHNVGSHNQRTFEVPGAGGILLSPFSKEQASFFLDGEEIFLYQSLDELITKAEQLLSSPFKTISDIRENAHEASIARKYAYRDRAIIVTNVFQNI